MNETGFGTMGVFDCGQDETHEVVVHTDGDQISWHEVTVAPVQSLNVEDVIDGITIPSIRNLSLNDLMFNLRSMKSLPLLLGVLCLGIFLIQKYGVNIFKRWKDKKDNNKNVSKLTIKVPIVSVGILKPHKPSIRRDYSNWSQPHQTSKELTFDSTNKLTQNNARLGISMAHLYKCLKTIPIDKRETVMDEETYKKWQKYDENKRTQGDTELIKLLRGKNVSKIKNMIRSVDRRMINQPNNLGNTPLNIACQYQTKEVIELLLKNGAKASINTPTKEGWTQLIIASQNQTKELK